MNSECESCGYTKTLKEFTHRRNEFRKDVSEEAKKITLCDLCARTMAGTYTQFPAQCENLEVLQSLCLIGNLILEKLDGFKKP